MNDTTQITEIRDTLRATPVGSCIYCGATDQLTDEHIIPVALAGRIVLPDASCRKCAGITSDFEQRVLRGFMLDARTAGGYPTRRPKKRPQSLPLQIERDGAFEQVELMPKEHPALLVLPLLDPPGVLAGRKHGAGVSICGYETIYFGKNPAHVAKGLGVKTIRTTHNWDVTSFARLLAKISYGFAIASLGSLQREQIVILPLILGETDDASFWLGSANFKLAVEAKGPTHALAHTWISDPRNIGNEFLIVRLKLFVPSGAAGYEIVVCRRQKTA